MSPGLVILLLVALLAVLVTVALVGAYVVSHPPRLTAAVALGRGLPIEAEEVFGRYERLDVTAADGVRIDVWLLRGGRAAGPAVFLLHGWGDSRYGLLEAGRLLAPHVSRIAVYDQRAHGESLHRRATGGAAEADDLRRVIEAIRPHLDHRPLLLVGHSMGGVLAIGQAAALGAAGVIADSPYLDPIDVMKRMMRLMRVPAFAILPMMLAWMRLLGGRRDTAPHTDELAARLTVPLLVLHGEADRVVPVAHARQIADAAPHGRLVTIAGADHLAGAATDPSAYGLAVEQFIAEIRSG